MNGLAAKRKKSRQAINSTNNLTLVERFREAAGSSGELPTSSPRIPFATVTFFFVFFWEDTGETVWSRKLSVCIQELQVKYSTEMIMDRANATSHPIETKLIKSRFLLNNCMKTIISVCYFHDWVRHRYTRVVTFYDTPPPLNICFI